MNSRLDTIFHALVCVAAFWIVLHWAAGCCGLGRRSRAVKLGFGVAVIALPFVTVGNLPFWDWAFSFCPTPSVLLLALMGAALWRQFFGVAVLQPADWRAAWIFGAVSGTGLYFHATLFRALDLYYWGWHGIAAPLLLAALAVGFLARGNRLGVLLLAALMAFELDALPSRNCWDYVVDPSFWMIGLGWVTVRTVRWWRHRLAVPVLKPSAISPA
jgi:hypothetical protein